MTRPPGRGPQPDPGRRPAPGVTDLRGRLRSGFGSPEGVVYAGIGSQYQDIDPAGAGAIYKKTTASGNTGWVELGAGGGGRSYCVIGFDAHTYSLPGPPVSSYLQAFPFDVVVANTGDYTIDWTFDIGAGIAPNQDGFYRLGLTGHAEWVFDLTTGAGSLTANETEVNRHWFEITCFPTVGHGSYRVRQPLDWGRIMDPAGTTLHRLVHDGPFQVQVISGPIELAAGDYVESFFTPTDTSTVSALSLDGELSSDNPVRFWIERVG